MQGESKHGGNLRRAQELYGRTSFIDLSANINPFGPPAGVWQALREGLADIVNYPDPESLVFRKTLSHTLDMPLETIMAGNGAGGLLYTIVQALKPQKAAIPIPAFSEYERACRSVGAVIKYIPLGPEGWDKLAPKEGLMSKSDADVEKTEEEFWRETLQGCDLLVLCSPHNPTGSLLSVKMLERILQLTKELGCRVLCDESFLDFLPDGLRNSARNYLPANDHLIVLYSLTKFYSLPGLRLGAVFARPSLLAEFERHCDPWSVNAPAQQAGIAALADVEFPAAAREMLRESKSLFYREFARCSFDSLRLWPTSVNFALLEALYATSAELTAYLGRRGILVRDCADFRGLPGNFIRIALKDSEAMVELLEGLKAFGE